MPHSYNRLYNAMGVALYLYLWLGALRANAQSPLLDSWWWEIGLSYYAASVVYGRLYAGMHSLMGELQRHS